MKRHLYTILFSTALLAFTLYISLDTFVLKTAYNTNATAMNTEMFSEEFLSQQPETHEDQVASDHSHENKPDNADAESSTKEQHDSSDTKHPKAPTKRPEGFISRMPFDGDKPFDSDMPFNGDKPSHRPGHRSDSKDTEGDASDDTVDGSSDSTGKNSDADHADGSDKTPTADPSDNTNKTPATDPAGNTDKTPATDPAGIAGNTPNADPANGTGKTPAADPANGTGKTPAADPSDNRPAAPADNSQNDQPPENTAAAVSYPSVIGSYANGDYSITLTEYYEYDTYIYVADITVASAQFLKTAFADDTYGKNITGRTSGIAQSKNAILAINGDYYGVRETGYVIRNGIVYRDVPSGVQILCVKADGTMSIVNDSDYTAQQLVESGVWQAFSFGPALVSGSKVTVNKKDEVSGELHSNPRTAIGMIDVCHYVFVVSDGRTSESAGLSLYDLASFMHGLGAKTAYNLDGGGSSTMYFNGQVINKPTTNGVDIKERGISDIVYIG